MSSRFGGAVGDLHAPDGETGDPQDERGQEQQPENRSWTRRGAAGAASNRMSVGASSSIGAGTGHRDCRVVEDAHLLQRMRKNPVDSLPGEQHRRRDDGIANVQSLLIGSLLIVAAAVFWLLPDGPIEPRLPLSIFGPLLVLAGWLSWRYYEPAEKRSVRLVVSIYLFLGIAITAGGLIQRFAPDPDAAVAVGRANAGE